MDIYFILIAILCQFVMVALCLYSLTHEKLTTTERIQQIGLVVLCIVMATVLLFGLLR